MTGPGRRRTFRVVTGQNGKSGVAERLETFGGAALPGVVVADPAADHRLAQLAKRSKSLNKRQDNGVSGSQLSGASGDSHRLGSRQGPDMPLAGRSATGKLGESPNAAVHPPGRRGRCARWPSRNPIWSSACSASTVRSRRVEVDTRTSAAERSYARNSGSPAPARAAPTAVEQQSSGACGQLHQRSNYPAGVPETYEIAGQHRSTQRREPGSRAPRR